MNDSLEGCNAVHLIRDLRRRHRERKVIVLSAIPKSDEAVSFMGAGASDYVLKILEPKVIVEVLERALLQEREEKGLVVAGGWDAGFGGQGDEDDDDPCGEVI